MQAHAIEIWKDKELGNMLGFTKVESNGAIQVSQSLSDLMDLMQ